MSRARQNPTRRYIPFENPMPELYAYTDYRKYLSDAWSERKSLDPRFSHRFIAQRAGFASSAFFSRILSGDVNLTPSGALRLADVFHLGYQETRYFELLVLLDQARSQEERMHFLDRIAVWRKTPVSVIESSQVAFCRDWRAVAILESLDLVEHRDDHAFLGSLLRPAATGDEFEAILSLLEDLELARRDADGIWRKTEAIISTGDSDSEAIDIFRQSTMELGIAAIDRFSREDRSISTLTVTLSKASFERLRDRLRHLRRDILAIARGDDEIDRVVQINFQAFPLVLRPKATAS